MKVQLLSDLHLETEAFTPRPAPGADVLILGGDIDSSWEAFARFERWPVPVVLVAGNHEFDRRDIDLAQTQLRERCQDWGIHLLERDTLVLTDARGQRVRLVGTTRWCDFDVFGASARERAMRAAVYFVQVMRATRHGQVFGPEAVRAEALQCRQWLHDTLHAPQGNWDKTVVVTHFAPSLQSADPRYGKQITTANFCNADDDLLPLADLWLHGHVHHRHDYRVGRTRIIANPRGYERKRETAGHDDAWLIDVTEVNDGKPLIQIKP